MTKVIDLRPDRKLLNTNFEKYQFCSETIQAITEKKLENEILRIEPSSSQDSWLEARLFAFHNHLFTNPYDSTCWFVDKVGGIYKFNENGSLDLVSKSEIINLASSNYVYNPSIAFASKNIFVISNGSGNIEFFIESDGSYKNFSFDEIESAVILDARFVENNSKIILAIYTIDEKEGKRFSKLIFLYYNYDKNATDKSDTIKLIQKQILKIKGGIECVYIEKNGNYCHIISHNQVEFEYDSLNSIKTEVNSENDSETKVTKYCWSQDEDSITVYVNFPKEHDNATAKIEAKPNSLSIAIGDKIFLSGETLHKLESDLTTWKHKDDTLEVELSKSESGLMWNELIKGDTGGEYLPNEALAAEIHARLSHLCSSEEESKVQGQPAIGFNSEQLEDCDLSGEENILQKVNLNTHTVSHMAMLGSSNTVLFTKKQLSGQVVCLRYDHDGCVWTIKESDNDNWNIKHTYTFPAFGYVEASKRNKKFCISSPDGSFIVIVEHTRHAFLYERPEKNMKVGKQKILDFGSEMSPILGAVAMNKCLILLTKDILYQLQIYS